MNETGTDVADLRLGVMRLARRLRAERPDDALTPSQVAVLGTLVREGPKSPTELAAIERIQPPSMTRILDSLLAEDLVMRNQDPEDGRRVLISLTAKAQARIDQSRQRKDAWLHEQLAELSTEERQQLLEVAKLLNQLALN